jgi:hypothetical protein
MPFGEVCLDPHLIADVIRNPSATPPLHPSNVRLWQTRHAR